jgi:hypothetical protein
MDLADALNQHCFCKTLNPERLRAQLEVEPSLMGLAKNMATSHPHLFSSTAVFVTAEVVRAIASAVQAIERVMALPTWRVQALTTAGPVAQADHGPLGVFMGYDFHISPTGPQLIEINTNAGGALLNTALVRAQTACCAAMDMALNGYRDLGTLEADFLAMFQSEWKLQRPNQILRTIAIVDDAPAEQYLAPEFQLFKHLFAHHGFQSVVADAADLQFVNGLLKHRDHRHGLQPSNGL